MVLGSVGLWEDSYLTASQVVELSSSKGWQDTTSSYVRTKDLLTFLFVRSASEYPTRMSVPVQSRKSILSYAAKLLTGGHTFTITVDRSRLIIKNQYDANESLLNLFKFSGTAIQFIFFKPVTWFCIALHYFGFFYVKSLRAQCQNGSSCWVDDFTDKYSIQFTDVTGI